MKACDLDIWKLDYERIPGLHRSLVIGRLRLIYRGDLSELTTHKKQARETSITQRDHPRKST